MKLVAILMGFLTVVGLLGCTSSESLDNPRQGTITIAADESFVPLVNALTRAYEGIYPDAHFNVMYKPEQEAILELLRDTARLAFVTRELNEKEKEIIQKQEGIQKAQFIAIDGIALIVNKEAPDSLITMQELEGIFKGEITDWSQLKNSRRSGAITLVFDDANSSNLRYMLDRFKVKDVTKLRLYTSGTNEKVIEHVRQNASVIGFIGVNWISDGNEVLTHVLSKGLRVMGVSAKPTPTSLEDYFQPFQRDLQYRQYPLSRNLYIISREGFSGLGGGLMTYIARDVGGLIIQKSGLIPAIPYPREVEVETKQNF
ncbi:phosphate transport system substrate-binding protein [Rhabdobacter roseus]|uniref:Phosphate transport system substrate-binding protein n=1 Tax=Rhabdobacter roseus TaxID=1655419 RepID=A0A840TTY7_9BACT|nr:substrate-binding domain-containing protein [Rhabdobacter roseus]MBB5286734.1 phosphate transport system substrate-binding protein [Rhabdobacter roseus]